MLPILGMTLLLLLSPCKVRNFVQAELDVPQTEVSNKSKSTISNSGCSIFEATSDTLVTEKSAFQNLPGLAAAGFESVFGESGFSRHYVQPHNARTHLAIEVPLYILYQSFKDYL
ncbi:hypothetical protein GCM10009122_04770 [Fulvivirga kasyanovii]